MQQLEHERAEELKWQAYINANKSKSKLNGKFTTDYEGHPIQQRKPRISSRYQVNIEMKPEDRKDQGLSRQKRIEKLRKM